jgi:hypothetical protein
MPSEAGEIRPQFVLGNILLAARIRSVAALRALTRVGPDNRRWNYLKSLVEPRGFEPLTSAVRLFW